MSFDVNKIREDFPILKKTVYNKPLVYFDNGATTQKPQVVIDTINKLHVEENSSIHRGVHSLSGKMTQHYEDARKTIQEFINAKHQHEIIFTSGATGSINTVAYSFGERFIKEGDEVLITQMEHHANIVPWQLLCKRKGATLKYIPINDRGELELDKIEQLITEKTRIMSMVYVSNSLGTVNPAKEIIDICHQKNVPVLLDAAQAIQHEPINVQDLDCDFLVFAGHKIYGPTGIGVLYGKEKWLDEIPPYQGGGDMVDIVTLEETTFNELPFKFEAGTTNYIGAIGLAEAIKYVQTIGLENIRDYEAELLAYGTEKLTSIEGLKIYGTAKHKVAILSFLIDNIHQYDTGMVLDKLGIAVRTGTHCTQPVMQRFGIEGTIRASLSFYNTKEEIDILFNGLITVKEMFG